jgi:secreted trypsin-like serine protease
VLVLYRPPKNMPLISIGDRSPGDGTDVTLGPGQFCDQSVSAGKGACTGDQGGPIIDSNGSLVGIIGGSGNCGTAIPEVNTDLVYYRDWITSKAH